MKAILNAMDQGINYNVQTFSTYIVGNIMFIIESRQQRKIIPAWHPRGIRTGIDFGMRSKCLTASDGFG